MAEIMTKIMTENVTERNLHQEVYSGIFCIAFRTTGIFTVAIYESDYNNVNR